jgi:CRP-like cAMP-binding protein
VRSRRPDISELRHADLFQGCAAHDLEQIAPHTDVLRLPTGSVIARAGQIARELVVAREGRMVRSGVHVTQVGGPEVLAGEAHRADVVAVTDVELLVVDGPAVRWIAHAEPTLLLR